MEQAVAQHWPRAIPFVMPKGLAATPVLAARINHNRWIVDCPFCSSAALASPDDRRFFCVNCLNAGAGGKWLTVSWPRQRAAIEAALLVRPDPATRNWSPSESTKDLLAENAAYIPAEILAALGALKP